MYKGVIIEDSSILEAEKSLFKWRYMSDVVYLDRIIDDNFVEIGKSGKKLIKKDVIEELSNLGHDRLIDIYNFECIKLNDNVWLAHYITLSEEKKIYRTSIWKNVNGNLKILFHQASEFKDDAELKKILSNRSPINKKKQ